MENAIKSLKFKAQPTTFRHSLIYIMHDTFIHVVYHSGKKVYKAISFLRRCFPSPREFGSQVNQEIEPCHDAAPKEEAQIAANISDDVT